MTERFPEPSAAMRIVRWRRPCHPVRDRVESVVGHSLCGGFGACHHRLEGQTVVAVTGAGDPQEGPVAGVHREMVMRTHHPGVDPYRPRRTLVLIGVPA